MCDLTVYVVHMKGVHQRDKDTIPLSEAFTSDNVTEDLLLFSRCCSDWPIGNLSLNLVGKSENVTSTGMYNTFVCAQ